MKKIIFSMVAVISILGFGLALAYADEFRMPFNPDNLVDHWVEVVFNPTGDGGVDVTVTQSSLFHYDNDRDLPDKFVVQYIDLNGGMMSYDEVVIKENYQFWVSPPAPEAEEPPRITPEMQAGIDEKIAEREQLYEEAVTCKAYGTEGNSMFQSYLEEQISKEKVAFRELPLDAQEKALIKAHEACRVFFKVAIHISDNPEMLNKFKAQQQAELEEAKRLAELETTTDYTDPITEEDIAETIETAEETLIKYPEFYKNPYGECEPADSERCQNRGGFNLDASGNIVGAECGIRPSETGVPTLDCPLKSYNALISSAISAEDNYANIANLVCGKYLNQYQHIVERIIAGDESAELPYWLAHCEVE